MDKLLEVFLEVLRDFAKKYIPRLNKGIEFALNARDRVTTQVARLSRKTGQRAILAVAVVATCYALILFIEDLAKPNVPKPTHDAILKARLSSPAPASNILIVDVDERSIAVMAESHGRWPWKRDVLAEGLQRLVDYGAKGVMFNILLSEPDKQNPDADGLMNFIAEGTKSSAYPIIRLAPENDKLSELKVSDLPGATVDPNAGPVTLAAILPLFGGMHDRLGIANQRPDADGVVRKYPYFWTEPGFQIPSIVYKTIAVSEVSIPQNVPDTFSLNWRNKNGSYRRVSFSDLYLDTLSSEEKSSVKDAFVILGVSAPGIGQTKPIGIKPTVDDSEILATALDDAINNTYLRITPAWALLILNLLSIWLLYLVFSAGTIKKLPLNRVFVVLQAALGGVTLISASYTNFLIDLTDSMKFGIGVFGAIKLAQSFDDRWSRGRKGYRKLKNITLGSEVMILSYREQSLNTSSSSELQRDLERLIGIDHVVRLDDLFGGENFLKPSLSGCHVLIACVSSVDTKAVVIEYVNLSGPEEFSLRFIPLNLQWNIEDRVFADFLCPHVILTMSDLLNPELKDAIN